MAHYAKPLSFFLLLVLFFTTCLRAEARESMFFSKATHSKNIQATTNYVSESVSESPLLAPAPEAESQTSNANANANADGYGPQNHEASRFPTTTMARDENEIQTEQLSESDHSNKNNNNVNGYATGGYDSNEGEKQGMSDTRFLENGKYYYGAKNENFYDGSSNNRYYEEAAAAAGSKGISGDSEVYYHYYGKNGINTNEFDSMEEYDRQQGTYAAGYAP